MKNNTSNTALHKLMGSQHQHKTDNDCIMKRAMGGEIKSKGDTDMDIRKAMGGLMSGDMEEDENRGVAMRAKGGSIPKKAMGGSMPEDENRGIPMHAKGGSMGMKEDSASLKFKSAGGKMSRSKQRAQNYKKMCRAKGGNINPHTEQPEYFGFWDAADFAGSLGGTALGTAAGTALGTAAGSAVPIVGNVAGGLTGGALGATAGGALGHEGVSALHKWWDPTWDDGQPQEQQPYTPQQQQQQQYREQYNPYMEQQESYNPMGRMQQLYQHGSNMWNQYSPYLQPALEQYGPQLGQMSEQYLGFNPHTAYQQFQPAYEQFQQQYGSQRGRGLEPLHPEESQSQAPHYGHRGYEPEQEYSSSASPYGPIFNPELAGSYSSSSQPYGPVYMQGRKSGGKVQRAAAGALIGGQWRPNTEENWRTYGAVQAPQQQHQAFPVQQPPVQRAYPPVQAQASMQAPAPAYTPPALPQQPPMRAPMPAAPQAPAPMVPPQQPAAAAPATQSSSYGGKFQAAPMTGQGKLPPKPGMSPVSPMNSAQAPSSSGYSPMGSSTAMTSPMKSPVTPNVPAVAPTAHAAPMSPGDDIMSAWDKHLAEQDRALGLGSSNTPQTPVAAPQEQPMSLDDIMSQWNHQNPVSSPTDYAGWAFGSPSTPHPTSGYAPQSNVWHPPEGKTMAPGYSNIGQDDSANDSLFRAAGGSITKRCRPKRAMGGKMPEAMPRQSEPVMERAMGGVAKVRKRFPRA